jgi:hypothetical protein
VDPIDVVMNAARRGMRIMLCAKENGIDAAQ